MIVLFRSDNVYLNMLWYLKPKGILKGLFTPSFEHWIVRYKYVGICTSILFFFCNCWYILAQFATATIEYNIPHHIHTHAYILYCSYLNFISDYFPVIFPFRGYFYLFVYFCEYTYVMYQGWKLYFVLFNFM